MGLENHILQLDFKLIWLTEAIEYVPIVTAMPVMRNTSATMANITARLLAKREPTDETFLQCGHRAKALWYVLNCKSKRYKTPAAVIWINNSPKTCPNSGHKWRGTCPAWLARAGWRDLGPGWWSSCNWALDKRFAATSSCRLTNSCMGSEHTSCPLERSEWAVDSQKRIKLQLDSKNLLRITHSSLIAVGALDHVLLPLRGDVNHVLTYPTGDHRDASGVGTLLIRRRQLIGSNARHCGRCSIA